MGNKLTLHLPPTVNEHRADRCRRFSARHLCLALVSALSLGLPFAAHAASGEFLLDGYDSLDLTLQEAIDRPGDHHITLLKNLDIAGGLVVSGKTIRFALGGHDLTLFNTAGAGMQVNGGGAVNYTGAGSFTASSTAGNGLTVEDGNSSAELTGASTRSGGAYAVHANGKVTVTVRGDVAALGALDMGIKAENGAEVNVAGQVTAADASAIVAEHGGTSVIVAGNAQGSRPIDASGGAIVIVGGNTAAAGGGNATAAGGGNATGTGTGAPVSLYIGADGANKIDTASGALIPKAAPSTLPNSPWTKGNYYSFVVVPDPQIMINSAAAYAPMLGEWIKANRGASAENIKFVLSVGDNVNNANKTNSWLSVDNKTSTGSMYGPIYNLVPLITVPGNHDYNSPPNQGAGWAGGRNLTSYNSNLGTGSRWAAQTNLQKVAAFDGANALYKVTGVNYLILALEYMPRNEVISWANGVLTNPSYKNADVILLTHAYLNQNAGLGTHDALAPAHLDGQNWNAPRQLFNKLVSQRSNIRMVFGGHFSANELELPYLAKGAKISGTNIKNTVPSWLVDVQGKENDAVNNKNNKPFGMVLLVRVTNDGKQAQLFYYSTVRNNYFSTMRVQNLK